MEAGKDIYILAIESSCDETAVFDIVSADMSLDVMYTDQGNPCGKTDGLSRRHAHQKRSHQTRSVGHGDGIHPAQFLPSQEED